jgi:UDP-N-acetylmuramoyl-L-alanyl-D-glutamate--2,6-diaminopimelate ligase
MLRAAGRRAGVVTTVGARIGGVEAYTGLHVTTSDPEDVQRYLAEMVRAGCDTAILESTSHGLAQYRVDAVAFDVAVFTNVTREALDYHGTFQAYVDAKARLFEMLLNAPQKEIVKTGVMNADDPSYPRFLAVGVPRVVTFGLQQPADFRATSVWSTPSGTVSLDAETPAGAVRFDSSLVGTFNAANILAAAGAAHALGCPPAAWQAGAATVGTVPGRMESIRAGQQFAAYVDFAHTPNGLRVALEAARQLAGPARVLVVFGCAGLRDAGKRELMGAVAGELADVIVLTAEDPRTETIDQINDAIARGVDASGDRRQLLLRVDDRMEAIRTAVTAARSGDVVLVCGKGHEQSMCFGETEYPWDDRVALRAALAGERYGDLPTSVESPA